MDDVTHEGLEVIISTTDLVTSKAESASGASRARFRPTALSQPGASRRSSHCQPGVQLLLPPAEGQYTFEREPGEIHSSR